MRERGLNTRTSATNTERERSTTWRLLVNATICKAYIHTHHKLILVDLHYNIQQTLNKQLFSHQNVNISSARAHYVMVNTYYNRQVSSSPRIVVVRQLLPTVARSADFLQQMVAGSSCSYHV